MKKSTAVSMAFALSFGILAGCSGDDRTDAPSGSEVQDSDSQASDEQVFDGQISGTDYAEVFTVDPQEWESYDHLIDEIRTTTNLTRREALMHQAEDMLMNTGAVLPIYYYNDVYMQKGHVSNIYSNLSGCKYLMFAETYGDTLRLNLGGEPDGLDPALTGSVDGMSLAVNSFAGLYTYDSSGNVAPDLAADEQVSVDGLTYTIALRPDLKWSDGSALRAEDFIYAWNRVIDPATDSDQGYLFDIVARNDDGSLKAEAGVEGDVQTLTIELAAPCAYFNELLAFPAFFPIKQSEVENASDWQTNPGAWAQEAGFVTNGAYTLAAWVHDESLTYVKNPNYHRADEVEVETLQFMLSDDETAVYAAYKAGSLDFIDEIPADEIRDLLEDEECRIVDQQGTYYAVFNVDSPLFEGKTAAQADAMRRALALLVDRGYICEYIGQTGQKPANTLIPAGMADGHGGVFRANDAGYTFPDEAAEGYFDPVWSRDTVEEAIVLLEYAGYRFENGKLSPETPISFEYLTNNASGHIAVAEALQQDFAEIGIEMTINSMEQKAFLNARKAGSYDLARGCRFADINDPVNMLEAWAELLRSDR
ncbi:MAG: ABC transporter substrate-binding protein [Lachnospiraceae bacterium]|nr:ABC transporter substrate-binding protein [Lachnospiraceae bacterium]MCM1241009.1 ABC transporter substrate-binding protein [Lachnospiraceae bacterium]